MKKLYWRPQRISTRVLIIISFVALFGMVSVELFKVEERQSYYKEKMEAAMLAKRAFETIRTERVKRAIPIDPEADPANSGLVGEMLSKITTNSGHLPSKQTSINPNFAAVVVHLLKKAGVEEGDVVAVGVSGSFPALNICTYAALQTLRTKPVVISSAGSSQWGANITWFNWPFMEKILYDKRVFTTRSKAASLGGYDDKALGMSEHGRNMLADSIDQTGLKRIESIDRADSLKQRLAIYNEAAGENKIKAYINVGGGTISLGGRLGRAVFKPGLMKTPPAGTSEVESVMARMALDGAPLIHMNKVDKLAERYGLPLAPTYIAAAGEGTIYVRAEYNKLLVGIVLAIVLTLLWVFVRLDWGYRVFAQGRREASHDRPEPMV